MEERPAGTSASVADSPASAETGSSTRRRAGLKRKSNALSSSSSTPTSSKRLTREKAAISHAPIHNGPLTRAARQSPGNLAAAATSASLKREEKVAAAAAAEVAAAAAEEEKRSRLEKLESRIEAEFDVIRSRNSNAHVVPSHCGWFSWKKIHPLEERVLPSFFNGKSQARTPDIYMEIRNWIVKKFHANPNTQIEPKDLSELEVGDLDAREEVLEFLDYWGLINFHPFPGTDSVTNDDGDEAEKEKLLKNLFQFEESQQCLTFFPRLDPTTPAVPSGLFPDSAIAEELAKMEGPSVEYHCNSCSADCSRKRYHCQKQADYDLCADCFNNGKFGSNMSSSDFILMEPAEAAGASGGKWTDQETLLLLEALELYKENWNEIAEHVATKTKAQCILHFVQMPIEDVFFDCDDDTDSRLKETAEPASTTDEITTSKDGPDTGEGNPDGKDNQPLTSALEATKSDDGSESKAQKTAKPTGASEATIIQENLKSEANNEVNMSQEKSENIALKALTEAFESVGYTLTPENKLSFADVGNPVMALASFLGKLVGPEVAIASARSSLKSLSCNSPGVQLAARHCFILEDPPDDRKEQSGVDCTATEIADEDCEKDNMTALDDKNLSSDDNKKADDSVPEENKSPHNISIENINVENETSTTTVTTGKVEPGKLKKSIDAELPNDCALNTVSVTHETPSEPECPQNSVEQQQKGSSGEPSQLSESNKDVEMVPDLKPSEKNEPGQSVTPMSVDEPSQAGVVSKDVEKVPDSLPSGKNESEQPMKSNSITDDPDKAKDVDMPSLESSERNKSGQPDLNSQVENGPTTAKDQKNSSKEKPESKDIADDCDMDKIRCAAVSALSAAAVKAKLLANQEQDQIRQLAASLIEKQLHKLEMKLTFFNEMDAVIMRVKEQLDRSRQKLYHERAQIIAARLGLPPSSRGVPPSLPNRIAMNFANAIPRPPMGMNSQRPPISKPMGTMPSTASGPFVSTTTAGRSIRPSGQDNISSVVTK